MTLWDSIITAASKNCGIVTTKNIAQMGFSPSSLRQYARRHPDRLFCHASGVYEVLDQEATGVDPADSAYAAALALVGHGSYLIGSSVLDFYNLANADPAVTSIRATRQIRRQLPRWLHVSYARRDEPVDVIRGIRLQGVAQALLDANDTRRDYRLEALDEAQERNLVSSSDAQRIENMLAAEDRRSK